MKKFIISFFFLLSFNLISFAQPTAPSGKMWVPVSELTDEFNAFDNTKWQKGHPYWDGREPSKYTNDNVIFKDGELQLKMTVRDANKTGNWIWASCLTSQTKAFKKGMYAEARVKIANLPSSTAFWMQGNYSEIDVIENFGDVKSGSKYEYLNYKMFIHTHYFKNGWDNDLETDHTVDNPGQELNRDTYNTFGVWWKDNRTMIFYRNGVEMARGTTRGDFNEAMYMFFDTEAMPWIGEVPSVEQLNDDSRNTACFKWVHTFELADDDGGPVAVTGLNLNVPAHKTIEVGERFEIIPTVLPTNAANKEVQWLSDASNVLSINNGIVTGMEEGESTITIQTQDGSFSQSCKVTVVKQTSGASMVLTPIHDAYIDGSIAYNNNDLKVELNRRTAFLMFDLSSVTGSVLNAQLKLTVGGDRGNGTIKVFKGSHNNWTETNISTANSPNKSVVIASLNSDYQSGDSYIWDLDVSQVEAGEKLCLVIAQESGNDVWFESKEADSKPELMLKTGSEIPTKIKGDVEVNFTVKPVPCKNYISVQASEKVSCITIYNLAGSIVSTSIVEDDEIRINTSLLNSGIYILEIKTLSGKTKTLKIIKV